MSESWHSIRIFRFLFLLWTKLGLRFLVLPKSLKFSVMLLFLHTHDSKLLHYCDVDCGIQDISCIKDLTFLYEAATIEDIYLAYEQLKVDENSLYSCIGIAGAQASQDIAGAVYSQND